LDRPPDFERAVAPVLESTHHGWAFCHAPSAQTLGVGSKNFTDKFDGHVIRSHSQRHKAL